MPPLSFCFVSAFCRAVLEHLDITVNLQGEQQLPPAENRRVTIVSNHPLGGLDGLALIDMVARRYGCEPLFVVNDLLMAVEPLRLSFMICTSATVATPADTPVQVLTK